VRKDRDSSCDEHATSPCRETGAAWACAKFFDHVRCSSMTAQSRARTQALPRSSSLSPGLSARSNVAERCDRGHGRVAVDVLRVYRRRRLVQGVQPALHKGDRALTHGVRRDRLGRRSACSRGWRTEPSRTTYSSCAGRPSTESGRTSSGHCEASASTRTAVVASIRPGRKVKEAKEVPRPPTDQSTLPSKAACVPPSTSTKEQLLAEARS
jgi:hypothetical protein